MATRSEKRSDYDFSGIIIDELVAKPLVAVAIAESKMAREQVRLLLDTCFYWDEEKHCYRPYVIKMSVTRAFLQEGSDPDKPPKLREVVTYFDVPLITIFPLASLGIDTVNIDFGLEVTAQYTTETQGGVGGSHDAEVNPKSAIAQPASDVRILGKVAPRSSSAVEGALAAREQTSVGAQAAYSIEVSASPMALTKGLLSLIDLYTKAIEPVEMPEQTQNDRGSRS